MWTVAGILISIIGIIITVVIYYIQKTTKKQKVREEIVNFIRLKIQTEHDVSAQYIGAEAASICRKNKIKKIEIIEIIEDLISEYGTVRNKNAKQIINKLILLRAEIALLMSKKNCTSSKFQRMKYDKNVDMIILERMTNNGVRLTENEIVENAKYILKNYDIEKMQKE